MSPKTRLLIPLMLAAAPLCCGRSISIRKTTRSDNAFVRCFDLDGDKSVPIGEKQHCWTEWLGSYVYNQYDDKVRHAEMRLKELKGEKADAGEK